MLPISDALAKPDDPDYERVCASYDLFRRSRFFEDVFPFVNTIAEYLQLEMCQWAKGSEIPDLPYFDGRSKQCPIKYKEFRDFFVRWHRKTPRFYSYPECYD